MAQNEDSIHGTDDDRPKLRVVSDSEATAIPDGPAAAAASEDTADAPAKASRRSRSARVRSDKADKGKADKGKADDTRGDHTKGDRSGPDKSNAERPKGDRASAGEAHEPPQDPLKAARERLAAADPESTYKSLLTLVRSDHSELLSTLDYNAAFEFHDPTCVRVEPDPSGLETIDLYTHAAFPEFDRVLAEPFAEPRNDHLFNNLRNLLFEENKNVAMVTNHGQIIDIALVIGAFLLAVCGKDRSFGVLENHIELDDLADRTNVLVSRMVATQAAFGIPALQVLQIGARTFLSIPQTASRRRAKLDPEIARANNVVMRHELDAQMARGGQLLAMAASGSQDLSIAAGLMNRARNAWMKRRGEEPPQESTLHLQPLYDGTLKLMGECDYVLPIAISMDPAKPCCVLGEMTRLTEPDDCHRVMDWIAAAHEAATGVPTIYHWHEDDLMAQVRSIGESFRR